MGLLSYVARRLLLAIPTFFFTTLIIFLLAHLAPGDPIEVMSAWKPIPTWLKGEIRRSFGLDKPLYIQYFIWLSNALQGNLGYSYISGQWIGAIILSLAWNTIELMLTAQIVSLIVAVVLGVIAAVKQNSPIDAAISTLSLFGYSMPTFWLALLLIYVFSLNLGLLPTSGYSTVGQPFSLLDHLRHLILPVATMVINNSAYLLRLVRSSMIEVLSKSYIITARAKGLRERTVIYKHAFRNALLPLVTVVGISMGFLLGGSVIIESIFAWPGLGRFIMQAAISRDYPSIMGTSMIIVIMVLLANISVDIAYGIIDPRIRYE